MDIRKVKKLIELLEESGISEIEIKEGEESVRITRGAPVVGTVAPVHTPVAVAASALPETPSPTKNTEPDELDEGTVIESPMVGTYYASPAPGSPTFVSVGQKVKPGDIICIVEAMKILNQIESELSGTVMSLLVEDGQPVEFGQPLMVVN
ncbi:acetyl-CoA carboxylase, biotin carboxyl carrier protein [Chromatiales bacterium (ex Bugula neritina AB1)]|nr:acetyl-CoA carboxylase, biotin carboxyl carrier protein [Chromatiales bacterium (ex Bugula neritina AB1)]